MNKLYLYISFLSLCTLMSGCMVGPNFHSPPPPLTTHYTASKLPTHTVATRGHGGQAQHLVHGRDIPAEWWKLFHSEALNNLICRGFENSPNLKSAQAALRVSRENLRAEVGTDLLPAVDASFTAQRIRFSGASFGEPNLTSTFDLFNASIAVAYKLDVFGGLRRDVEAYRSLVDYQVFQLEATYLTLTANIVATAINEASLRGQIAATRELIRIDEDILRIYRQQFQLGGISRIEVLSQETQLAQSRANLPPLLKSLAQTRNALSVLVGALPSESALPIIKLEDLHLPTSLPISIPSLLVRQRPDVQVAEASLHYASAQIGVATANLLPNFTLSAGYGYEGTNLASLFQKQNLIYNYGIQILQPIFHGGALRAKRRAAIAAYEQALGQYSQTVLQGFQNVADSLQAIEHDAQTLHAQKDAEIASRQLLKLNRGQLKLGGASYLGVLTADRQYEQALINRIKAEAQRYTDTAALFQALGGGWWNRDIH